MAVEREHPEGTFPHALRMHRTNQNMSQYDLFEKSGIPQPKISALEHGRAPRPDDLLRLLKALELQPDQLLLPLNLDPPKREPWGCGLGKGKGK